MNRKITRIRYKKDKNFYQDGIMFIKNIKKKDRKKKREKKDYISRDRNPHREICIIDLIDYSSFHSQFNLHKKKKNKNMYHVYFTFGNIVTCLEKKLLLKNLFFSNLLELSILSTENN